MVDVSSCVFATFSQFILPLKSSTKQGSTQSLLIHHSSFTLQPPSESLRFRPAEPATEGIVAVAMASERGGGTLSEIYQSAKKLLLRTRDGLERLERLEYSSGIDSPDLCMSIRNDLTQIQSLCADMDRLWRSVGAKSQRDLWKRKVEQVAEEVESLKESLDKYNLRNQRKMNEARERAELLGRANGESSHVIRVFDEEAQAMQSARNSSRMLHEATSVGEAILSKYAGQREHIKRAQRKALDVLNTVGLSNSVLKLIERRHRVDQWIKYAGMILTVVIVFFFWRWTR